MSRWTMRRWRHERKWEVRLALTLTLAVGVLLGTLISGNVKAALDTAPPAGRALSVPSPVELSTTFAEVAKMVEPAVVNINTESIVRNSRRRRFTLPGPLEDFFDRFEQQQPERSRSLGSGVILDADGYILTNYHVIEGADRIQVRLAGETEEYDAVVVGYDEDTDLGVIKIDAGKKLIFAKLGNSDAAQVGDWVLAIGSPFGLSATVTAGIISYKGRSGQVMFDPLGQFKRYLQTDAAINRGNSGGPLVNMAGEVVGINTAIMSRQGMSAGVGFAMPSNTAVDVYNQILQHGRVIRGSIGISFDSKDSDNLAIMRVFGAEHGVMIQSVNPSGPADKAGLERGDIITQVDETPIHTGDDLINKVTTTPVGKDVRIGYIRDGKKRETSATVEDFRKVHSDRYASSETAESIETADAKLGVSLHDLNARDIRRLQLEEDNVGPFVQSVEPGSFVDDIGVVRGDIILEVNRERVQSVREFREVQKELGPGSDVVFLVLRPFGPGNFTPLYLGGTLPK